MCRLRRSEATLQTDGPKAAAGGTGQKHCTDRTSLVVRCAFDPERPTTSYRLGAVSRFDSERPATTFRLGKVSRFECVHVSCRARRRSFAERTDRKSPAAEQSEARRGRWLLTESTDRVRQRSETKPPSVRIKSRRLLTERTVRAEPCRSLSAPLIVQCVSAGWCRAVQGGGAKQCLQVYGPKAGY